MSREDDVDNRRKDNPTQPLNGPSEFYAGRQEDDDPKIWAILLFGLIGATVTTAAVTHLRRTADWIYAELTRSVPPRRSSAGRSSRSSFQEEAWRRYRERLQEEAEEEMERVERIRRMQSVFNRERNKYKQSYETWSGNGPGAYHQHFQRNDWYWHTDTSFRGRRTDFGEAPQPRGNYGLSHHYSVLGLDRWRTKPYSDDEIKSAFRIKAKEFHPDQNQGNKEVAESKFKEIMVSYEAIKTERKNNQSK